MKNVFSQGTEGITIAGDAEKSLINFPANEDWAMVCEVITDSDNEVVSKKAWDEGPAGKIYLAQKQTREYLLPGSLIILLRVGNYNPYGWLVIPQQEIILVQDLGLSAGARIGREVNYDSNRNIAIPALSETLAIFSSEPDSAYIEQAPFAVGRVYPGVKIQGNPAFYLVFLPGKGEKVATIEKTKTHDQNTRSVTLAFDHDAQGNVLDFRARESSVPTTGTVYQVYGWAAAGAGRLSAETLFRTEGSAGSFRVFAPLFGNHRGGPPATAWSFLEWSGFSPDTYQGFPLQFTPGCLWNTALGAIEVPFAGTGVSNKLSYYPTGAHPYLPPAKGSLQAIEYLFRSGTATSGSATTLVDGGFNFGGAGVKVGMTVVMQTPSRVESITSVSGTQIGFASGAVVTGSTTYQVEANLESTVVDANWPSATPASYSQYDLWPQWRLELDEVANVSGSEDFTIDGRGAFTGAGHAHYGLNDNASQIIVYMMGPVLSPHLEVNTIPNWGYASAMYAPATFVSGYDFIGGRIIVTRRADKWFAFSASQQEWTTLDVAYPFGPPAGAWSVRVADRWLGIQRHSITKTYGITFV